MMVTVFVPKSCEPLRVLQPYVDISLNVFLLSFVRLCCLRVFVFCLGL